MSDTDRAYRMTYKLTTGPGKRRSELGEIGKDEGACDHLLIVSILGTPGDGNAMSLKAYKLGPDGSEPISQRLALTVAVYLLSSVEGVKGTSPIHAAVGEALAILRRAWLANVGHGEE